MRKLSSLKERWFRKGLRRSANRHIARVAKRASRESLRESFAELGIAPGAVICVQSALSSLGYLVEGPESVILALQEAVPGCTIMMPTFPFGGSAFDYVSSKQAYDPLRTPSMSGLLTEAFRKMPGVRRSLHPTHPCATVGPAAEELIAGAELSIQPFGDSSTFGRFSKRDDAVVLLIHTNTVSIAHRVQEIVDWPHLFLPARYDVCGTDQAGATRTYAVRVHTPVLPQYVVLADDVAGQAQYVWLANYMVQFPSRNAERIAASLVDAPAKRSMLERQQHFFETKTFQRTTLGNAEILAIHVTPWLDRICRDVRESFIEFERFYTLERLRVAQQTGLLTH